MSLLQNAILASINTLVPLLALVSVETENELASYMLEYKETVNSPCDTAAPRPYLSREQANVN